MTRREFTHFEQGNLQKVFGTFSVMWLKDSRMLFRVSSHLWLSNSSRLCMNPINSSPVVEGWRVCPECERICGTSTAHAPHSRLRTKKPNTFKSKTSMDPKKICCDAMIFFRKSQASSIFVFAIFGLSLKLAMTSHKSSNDPPTPHWPSKEW